MTLDAIGKKYGITRERVRQIENYGIAHIRKSEEYKEEKAAFAEIETLLHSLGGIVVEEDFLGHVSKDKSLQNHIHFLLVVGSLSARRRRTTNSAIAGTSTRSSPRKSKRLSASSTPTSTTRISFRSPR
jgi:hypothetical protein